MALTITIFLTSQAIYEWNRYFNVWGPDASTQLAFTSYLTDISDYLNSRNERLATYIVATEDGVQVNGVSIFAQPIQYLTRTHTQLLAESKRYVYLDQADIPKTQFPRTYILIPTRDTQFIADFAKINRLSREPHEDFVIYRK
jgi:hypothetical protein